MRTITTAVATLLAALTVGTASAAVGDVITLDLTKATTPFEFDTATGGWTGTYDDASGNIDCQCFTFARGAMSAYMMWWGFTVSNAADNSAKDDFMTYQFNNMACGGIALNADGTVRKDARGAISVDPSIPYLIGYYGDYNHYLGQDAVVTFKDGKSYEAVGMYVNLTTWPYYSVEYGDAFSRRFTEGDCLTLTAHGIATDGTERTLDIKLASFADGDLTVNRGWKWVDLTGLGLVKEIYFTMTSTDSSAYGMNTPGYFAMDKLTVRESDGSGVNSVSYAQTAAITYDRHALTVSLPSTCDNPFAIVYDATGAKVMTADTATFSVSGLQPGMYLIKSGNNSLKIAR